MKQEIQDRKTLLSTVWIFVVVNYIYCDVLSHLEPGFIQSLIDGGELIGLSVDDNFLLMTAVFMEIPFAMILLSRVLKYKANRWANIIAGSIMTVAQIASLFVGEPTLYYSFYSIIEIGCTVFVVWYAWGWEVIKNE